MLLQKIHCIAIVLLFVVVFHSQLQAQQPLRLAITIAADSSLNKVKAMAADLIKSGFTAGSGYGEVWIRDFNTFIGLSCKVMPKDSVKRKLRVFFQMQGKDGNIIDGYIPKNSAHAGYDYIYNNNAPAFAGHKNTVETDQESSLISQFISMRKKQKIRLFFLRKLVGCLSVHECQTL